ncbi:hypothetical protein BJV77DRAFT_1159268 [Russula vinacea]|nr:hypothetical protein BJV77DRAFT_1159268 [Russula vinacea]
MGNCCCSPDTVPSEPAPSPRVTQGVIPSRTTSEPESTHHGGMSSQVPNPRSRTKSAPQRPQSSRSPSPQNPRIRAETLSAPKRSSPPLTRGYPKGELLRSTVMQVRTDPLEFRILVDGKGDSRNTAPKSSLTDSRPTSLEHSKSGVHAPTMSYPSRRSLNSTAKQVRTDQPEILVVGKVNLCTNIHRSSGQTNAFIITERLREILANSTFRVDMSAAPARDINFAFRPGDNHHLIVHESAGFEPGDAQGLRAIRDFISNRTDPSRAAAERLHAIWICVPSSDAVNGSIGEGVEEILGMRNVPVVVAFTKSDLAFPHISGSDGGNSQYQDRARSRACAQCEQSCRPLFHREPRDVPAELVSVVPQYGALINNLIVTTG